MNGVAREDKWNSNISVGFGYIAIPFGVNRDRFVKTCYRKERVHIILDQGGTMVKDCYIDSKVLQEVKFPDSYKSLGSTVVFVMDRFNKVPVIVASLTRSRERVISDEESFTIEKELNNGLLSIVGSGDGKIIVNLRNESGARVIVNIKGENSSLELNNEGITTVYSKSDINIISSSKIVKQRLNSSGEVEQSLTINNEGLEYTDDKGNTFKIDYENSKIIHNEGSQPLPLGDTLKEELNKLNQKFNAFLDAYSNTPVVPSDGGAAVQTAVKAAVVALDDADFDNINSEKSFID